jgi:hypothetical protein
MNHLLCLSAVCLCFLQIAEAQDITTQYTPLEQLIGEAADKYDVYFTFEGSSPSNIFDNLLRGENVATTNDPGDIDALISAITKSITHLIVVRQESNKHIYHIIDKRLLSITNYSMSRILESMKFEGDGFWFVNHVGKTVPSVVNQRGFVGMAYAGNQETTISIDKAMVSVRDAFSDSVNLHAYSRIMWTAFTPLETHRTYVHFIGPLIDMEMFEPDNATNHQPVRGVKP